MTLKLEGRIQLICDDFGLAEHPQTIEHTKARSFLESEIQELKIKGVSKPQYFFIRGCLCSFQHHIQKEFSKDFKKIVNVSSKIDQTPRGLLSETVIELAR